MSQLLDFYEYNKNDANITGLATEYLLRDTLGKNLKNNNKIKDIDGMDMESRLTGRIVPGMIFTFNYKPKLNKTDIVESLNMGDNFPIILCCKVSLGKKIVNGIPKQTLYIDGLNLNMLTKIQRLKILDFLHSSYPEFYEHDIYVSTYNNVIGINEDLGNKLQNFDFLKILSKLTGVDLSSCFRKYDITNCVNIRLIEYNLWKYIPFYNPKRYLLNLTKTQKEQIMLMLNV